MATFMLGYASNGGYYEIQDQNAQENYQWAGYFQDNWRANNKLTVNLGLRYDVTLPRTERHNRQNWFNPNATSPLQVPGVGPGGGTGPLVGGEVFASPSPAHGQRYRLERLAAPFRLRLSVLSQMGRPRRFWSVLLPEQVWRHWCCPLQQSGL